MSVPRRASFLSSRDPHWTHGHRRSPHEKRRNLRASRTISISALRDQPADRRSRARREGAPGQPRPRRRLAAGSAAPRDRRVVSSSSVERNAASCSRCLIVGNTSRIRPSRWASSAVVGREPTQLDALLTVHPGLLSGGQRGEEEVGVKTRAHLRRGDPARELHERGWIIEHDRGLLAQLADRRRTMSAVALALVRVHRASRGTPRRHP